MTPLLARRPLVPLALLALLGAARGDDDGVDCAGMRTKELRKWLAARDLKCDGCAEKADFVALCENNRDAPLVQKDEPPAAGAKSRIRTPGDGKDPKDQDINDILKSMKGMPGMENVKMFTADDLKNMGSDGWRASEVKPASEWRAELESFYKANGLDDKLAGVDAAMEKWKGREDKMMNAVRRKYAQHVEL